MARLLRHRQTKGAETDWLILPPPRHIPTLPGADVRLGRVLRPLLGVKQTRTASKRTLAPLVPSRIPCGFRATSQILRETNVGERRAKLDLNVGEFALGPLEGSRSRVSVGSVTSRPRRLDVLLVCWRGL